MSTNYEINYDDKRFAEVEAQEKAAKAEVDATYGSMISNSDKFFDKQIQAAEDYAAKQSQIQQAQTDFAIEQIEQQKAQAKKDYTKEQSGAYADWQKQSNQYGANAEQMAAQGMQNTGYSESSQVSMYNTYQNRVATARESYNRAVLNYDNAIKDARLQNNAALAEIAYNALQKQLELSLQGFQYKNQLIIEQSDKKLALDSEYHDRWQDVLGQINTENALAEEVRQHNEQMAEERRQYNESLALQKAQLAEEQRQFNARYGGSGTTTSGRSSGSKSSGSKTSGGKISGSKKTGGSNSSIEKGAAKTSSNEQKTLKSVINLGYGPISGQKLESLVAEGKVEEYTKNGVQMFRNTNKGNTSTKKTTQKSTGSAKPMLFSRW